MRIDEILREQRPVFSFEFFPPKTDEGYENLRATLDALRDDDPDFVSVTYGALGSTRDRTIDIVKWIKQDLGIEAMAHFTCVGATREELRETLRGDRGGGRGERAGAARRPARRARPSGSPPPGGLLYSTELIELLGERLRLRRRRRGLPRGAPRGRERGGRHRASSRRSRTPGAQFFITQLFFDNEHYFDFCARAREAGITVPIIPGMMPVTRFRNIKRITELCKSEIPEPFERELEAREDDDAAVQDLGVAYATLQCVDLLARGAPGIHFYTLNRSPATRAILAALRAAQPWTRAAQPV